MTAGSTGQPRATVADAMIRFPKVCRPGTTVAEVHTQFRDDHVHSVLIVDDTRLVAVVERPDLLGAPLGLPAHLAGRLAGRVIEADADLQTVRQAMIPHRRRLAVVDQGRLLGLLCLKRTGQGFCSDTDVQARAADHLRHRDRVPGGQDGRWSISAAARPLIVAPRMG